MIEEGLAIARVYSNSLLELAEAQGEGDALLEELAEWAAYLERAPAFQDFLSSPMVDTDARKEVLEKLLRGRASDLLVDALQVLNRKNRLGLLRGIAESYRLAHQEMHGFVEVRVLTAVPLTNDLRTKLRETTGVYTGRQPRLVELVDESIIGGIVIRIGDEKLDTSVSSRLRKLSASFAARASQEIHGGKAFAG